jgi:hypothetical protein
MVMPKWAHSIRQWLEIMAVIAIAIFIGIWIFNHLPFIEGKLQDNSGNIQDLTDRQEESIKKINDLESMIRKLQTHTTDVDIPQALSEKDIDKSMQRLQENW